MLALNAVRRFVANVLHPTPRCAGCGERTTPAGPLFVRGRSNIYICRLCVEDAKMRVSAVPPGGAAVRRPGDEPPFACSFCGIMTVNARGVVALSRGAICIDCLQLCDEIFETAPKAP